MKLIIDWDLFSKQIDDFIEEAKTIYEKENSIKDELGLNSIKEEIKQWNEKCFEFLNKAFDIERNEFAEGFYYAKEVRYNFGNQQKQFAQLKKETFEDFKSKQKTLTYYKRILSISDAIINPQIDLAGRISFTTDEILELILEKLYELYDDYYHSIGMILEGNGISLKRHGEERELAKMLEERGLVRLVHTKTVTAQLTTEGRMYVEGKRKKEKPTPMINKNKIELSTRRNILDGFMVTQISWYGNLEQSNFLGRLFDLSKLPSTDTRYKSADEDIWKHTVANNDWPDEWVFTDRRFNFLHVDDKLFLEFLSLTIHPTVRDSQEQVVTLLEIYNNNLSKNGFELYQVGEIAGKPVFGAREIKATEAAPVKSQKQTRLALVIGCSEYIHASVLANPLNDANSIEQKLKNLGFDVMKVLNPSQKELKSSIDEFGDKLKNYDNGLFYFAGHGVQVKGLNFLIPIDANLKTERMVEYDCVEASRVLAYMEESKSQVNIVILDACRDNPFERSWGRGISQRGLTTMSAPSGSLIAYSTSPGKTASDGDGSNGLYTHSLLEHIGSKQVTVMTMFQKVRNDVMVKSNKEQIPWEATSLTADYFFNP